MPSYKVTLAQVVRLRDRVSYGKALVVSLSAKDPLDAQGLAEKVVQEAYGIQTSRLALLDLREVT